MTEIPGSAVKAEAADISEPIALLLRGLSLLPNESDLEKAGKVTAAFTGPPDSVSVIEAGASAAAKWWSVTIAGGGLIAGGTILKVWEGLGKTNGTTNTWNQAFALLALGLVFAAAGLGISYLLGFDVRGRAAASVATIEARRAVAVAMLTEAGKAYRPPEEDTPNGFPFRFPGCLSRTCRAQTPTTGRL